MNASLIKLAKIEKSVENTLKQLEDLQKKIKELCDLLDKRPGWVNWEAIDMDGDCWRYEKEPEIDVEGGYFRSIEGYSEYIGTRSTTDWTKSLKRIER